VVHGVEPQAGHAPKVVETSTGGAKAEGTSDREETGENKERGGCASIRRQGEATGDPFVISTPYRELDWGAPTVAAPTQEDEEPRHGRGRPRGRARGRPRGRGRGMSASQPVPARPSMLDDDGDNDGDTVLHTA